MTAAEIDATHAELDNLGFPRNDGEPLHHRVMRALLIQLDRGRAAGRDEAQDESP